MRSSCAPARLLSSFGTLNDAADISRLEAQAPLIAAYEERKWPRGRASIAEYDPANSDGPARPHPRRHGPDPREPQAAGHEVLRGKKGLSMAMIHRLRARFRVPADLFGRRRQSMRRPVAALNERRPDWPWRKRRRTTPDRPLADSARLGPETYRWIGRNDRKAKKTSHLC